MIFDNKSALLSTAYLGPIQYFSKFIAYPNVVLEKHENYMKQTFRNRCVILGANGPQALTIPVIKGGSKTPIQDLKIGYETDWQRLHWRSITSAYNSSPFFEYLEDEFAPFYQKKWKYLFDFNSELQQVVFDMLEMSPKLSLTSEYNHEQDESIDDYRMLISPKSEGKLLDGTFEMKPYIQVFHDKMPFHPNLSILDLLFNEGANAYAILEESIQKK